MTFDLFARLFTLFLHAVRFSYWFLTERLAHKQKPLLQKRTHIDILERGATMSLGLLIGMQLLFLRLLPFPNTSILQAGGVILVLVGIGISIQARVNLGANWAHAADYQIKKNHTLVITGIYKYIRHPIYIGMSLAYVGAEIVAGSWLFLPLIPILGFISMRQAVKEETLLNEKFGEMYERYKESSFRFIPFIY
jgi:protein-S-isoprenylcysteine O-methyltransferase Ste14